MAIINKHDTYTTRSFKTGRSFESWLSKNHHKADGIWLKIAKAGTGITTVSHKEALDVALCYGWIDGLRRGLDEKYFLQKFTPRRANSIWSVINKKKVAELISDGKMQETGLAAIAVAKKNGRWKNAYESSKTIQVPKDFQKLLDGKPKAKAFFEKLNSQNRYAILFRLAQVKRPETRLKNMGDFLKMLEDHKVIYPQKDIGQG